MTSRLDDYINHVYVAGNAGAWYAALALSLALPDICSSVEYPNEPRVWKRYGDWCTTYVTPRDVNLTGADLYVLRCSFLHTGTAEIQNQPAYEHARIERIYLTQSVQVCANGIRKMTIPLPPLAGSGSTPARSRYALPVGDLCEQIVGGAGTWQRALQSDSAKLAELDKLLEIHVPALSPTTGTPT